MRVNELSEDEIIAKLVKVLPQARNIVVPSGDDCAVLDFPHKTAISVDLLNENVHFRTDWSTGYDVGYRAATQNLADSVAMGAIPRTLAVGIAFPADTEMEWLLDFARGMRDACEPLEVGVDGGDLVRGEYISISVTVLGDVETPILRSGARPGDLLIHAGVIGRGMAGMALLEAGYNRENVEPDLSALIDDFLRPKPPLEIALNAAKTGCLTAMMDVSDGLIKDTHRIARRSRVWIDIDEKALRNYLGPLGKAAGRLAADRRLWLCEGGEDHGFIATMKANAPVPDGFTVIGQVKAPDMNGRVSVGGAEYAAAGGWDHFHN
ncbi:thiamine-monophosphate kinase [Arcanobacterium pluranimalium]|uniref:thiamine-phosphate kinase n=1 Tax=Arcanobacterium pluranimalium TaxID=108028 RepID=UPI001958CA1F|nr:thiamine-phosphate kinase [Arcanobacterium pluranimalium]MBM7825212.1 thiamine-monophosphate kinase [Arcanobacterium pluranimalium]